MTTEETAAKVESPQQFNPEEKIEVNTSTEADFTEVSSEESGKEELQKELKEGTFSKVDVNDFTAFNVEEKAPQEGEYCFQIKQKFLKHATYITQYTSSASKATFGNVKITIFKDKLKMATFNQAAFSEIFIPLSKPVDQIEEGKEVYFVFDQNVMARIANTFPDAEINFKFDAKKLLLIIESGNTHLQLSTADESDFVKYHASIGEPEFVGKIDTRLLEQAVSYTSKFVKKNDVQRRLSLIDCREGMMMGGTNACIAVFKAESLASVPFKIKFEVMNIISKLCSSFHSDNTYLFQTEKFYILRDENLYLGFEKTTYDFPEVNGILGKKTTGDYMLIPRDELRSSIKKLSVVSADRDLLIRCELAGSGKESTLTLVTKDNLGKSSKDIIGIFRGADEGRKPNYEERFFNLNISALKSVVSHFDTSNVAFREIDGKAVLVSDEGEGFTTTTIVSILNEEAKTE
jgi:DNA polymerase III sliding clamp (beta) subunit (PCNA family)